VLSPNDDDRFVVVVQEAATLFLVNLVSFDFIQEWLVCVCVSLREFRRVLA
jgi:hypothetical protein